MTIEEVVGLAPVVPVVVIEDSDDAVPIARALVAGGLPAIEVTLRTEAAGAAIARIAAEVPGAVVGAGTVVAGHQVAEARAAGARFLVTPGSSAPLLDALEASGLPFLPGVATASDVVALLERGITLAKLFPAQALGGLALLRAFAGPFAQMRFCPTGGIGAALAAEYLRLPNVVCVGGSWMLPADAIRARDWDAIERLARAAAQTETLETAPPPWEDRPGDGQNDRKGSTKMGSEEPAFHLELTPEELKITHSALKAFLNDFGHKERDIRDVVRRVLNKLPDEASITSIRLAGRR
jgi:2-dehydro-3-deoxyphosphogluconate aldolase/(4S)-4-hydroxy-2-oxoglutarate aldolase